MAALARFGSRLLTLGYTLVITYGVQKAICARSMVRYPFRNPMEENRSISPMAVTISGFKIGRLLIFNRSSFTTFLDLERPIAVIVPIMVEITVARIATVRDTYTALLTSVLWISSLYQRMEKPVNLVRDFDELKEKIMVTKIGR